MKSLSLITSCLVLTFCFALSGSACAQGTSANSSAGSSHSTFQGCLRGAAGSFELITSKKTYELVGNESELSKLAGREVSITGDKGSASGESTDVSGHTGDATSNPTAGTAPTIRVTSVTQISEHCGK